MINHFIPSKVFTHVNGLFVMRNIRNITSIAGKWSLLIDNKYWKRVNLLNTQKHILTLNCRSQLHLETFNWMCGWKEIVSNRFLHHWSCGSEHTGCAYATISNNSSKSSLNSQIRDYSTSWAPTFPPYNSFSFYRNYHLNRENKDFKYFSTLITQYQISITFSFIMLD